MKRQAYAQIASAQFAVEGSTYPTPRSLRLAYSLVTLFGNGKTIPAMTTLAGLYERAKSTTTRRRSIFRLSGSNGRVKLDQHAVQFRLHADIIGGFR